MTQNFIRIETLDNKSNKREKEYEKSSFQNFPVTVQYTKSCDRILLHIITNITVTIK